MNGGGRNVWISDGLCDDINNNVLCQFDGGDCCGVDVIRKFCSHCECLGNFIEKNVETNVLFIGWPVTKN